MGLEVKVKIGADGSGFKAALDTVKSQAKSFSGDVSSGVLTGFAKGVAGIIPGLKEKILSVFDPSAILERVRELAAKAKEIKLGSQRTGLDTDTYQRVANALELTGVSAEVAAHSIDHVAKTQDEIKNGAVDGFKKTEKLAEAYAVLGISIQQLESLSPQEIFLKIAYAMQTAAAAGAVTGEQTRALMELFGRGGTQLVPAFAKGFQGVATDVSNLTSAEIKKFSKFGEEWKATGAVLAEAFLRTPARWFMSAAGSIKKGMTALGLKDSSEAEGKDLSTDEQAHFAALERQLGDQKRAKDLAATNTKVQSEYIAKLEKETAEITEKAAFKAMSATERRAALTAEINRIERNDALESSQSKLAEDNKRLATLKAERAEIKDERENISAALHPGRHITADHLARIGLFTGGADNSIAQQQLAQLRESIVLHRRQLAFEQAMAEHTRILAGL